MHANIFFAFAVIFLIQAVQAKIDIRCQSRGVYDEELNRCDCKGTNYTGIHCQTERSVCQQNECGKANSCDVVNNVATCTCVEPPTDYEWDANCKILTSSVSMPEGNVSTLLSGQDSIEYAKYTMMFTFNANELCEEEPDVVSGSGSGIFTCNNTLFDSYKKNTTDNTTSDHNLKTFHNDSFILMTEFLDAESAVKATFDGQFSKSYIVITSSNFRSLQPYSSAWNLTNLEVDIEVRITLDGCDSNVCDGHVAGCTKDEVNSKSICTCKDGWKFSNGTLDNVCKDRVVTTCKNNGNYYMNDGVVACDCNHLPEWQGTDCNTSTTDCGGVGAHGCMHDSTCEKKSNLTGIIDHDKKYTCNCKPGFIGDKCQYNLYNWQTNYTSGVPYNENFTALEATTISHFWVVFAGKGENQEEDFFYTINTTDLKRNVTINAKICQPEGSCATFYTGTHEELTHNIHGYYYFEIFVSNNTQTKLNGNSSVDETISIDVTVTDIYVDAASRRRAIQTWEKFEDEQKNSTLSPRFAILAQVAQCETNSCSNHGRCELHYGKTTVCVCENGYEGIRCHLKSEDKDDDFPVWAIVLIATLGSLGVIALLMYICRNSGEKKYFLM